MRRIINAGLTILVLVGPLLQVGSGATLAQRIDHAITTSRINGNHLGIWIGSSASAQSIYEKNSNQSFIPASLTKLVTSIVVLNYFPHGYRFKTQLRTLGTIKDHILAGDLIFKGGGDPTFVSESMWILVNNFVRTGVKTITGNIIVDDLMFDNERFTPGRDSKRVDRAYDAPVGALSFNWNSVNVYVRPGFKVGNSAQVFIDPENNYIQVENNTKTIKGKTAKLTIKRKSVSKNHKKNDIIVANGSIGLQSAEKVKYVNIRFPEYWSAANLKSFLKQRGIKFTGSVNTTNKNLGGLLLAEVESRPIDEIVKAMMKFSNNYIAEMLTKHLAVKKFGAPGKMENGLRVIRDFLSLSGLSHIRIEDSSGISRNNRITPTDLARLLDSTTHQFQAGPEYLMSLPISGSDGTLKRRLSSEQVKGWVRAKTGLLKGVIGLAGHAGNRNGQVFTFIFIYNGQQGKMASAKTLFDKLVTILIRS